MKLQAQRLPILFPMTLAEVQPPDHVYILLTECFQYRNMAALLQIRKVERNRFSGM